jgi:hypothetical protein
MKLNINNIVKVKLTEHGHRILRGNPIAEYLIADEDGYTEWQMWLLFHTFGNHLYSGCVLPFETEIEIIEK